MSEWSYVFPISLKDVGRNPMTADGIRNDVLAEVRFVVVQDLAENLPVET